MEEYNLSSIRAFVKSTKNCVRTHEQEGLGVAELCEDVENLAMALEDLIEELEEKRPWRGKSISQKVGGWSSRMATRLNPFSGI